MKRKKKQFLSLILLGTFLSVATIAFTYGVTRSFGDSNTLSKGIHGNAVYVNDFANDYYYYTGQNYTYSSDGTLPTLTSKNLYGDSNLVEVTINYFGTDKQGEHTGYVSAESTERQNQFVYYKMVPIQNGYIDIELIDNPFSDRPNGLVFQGWITDYENATITLDSNYYTRHLKASVSGNTPITINVYASWGRGVIETVGSKTFNNVLSSLDATGLHEITMDLNIYQDPDVTGYYRSETITTTTTVTGSGRNRVTTTDYGTCTNCYEDDGTYHSSYQCPAPNTGGGGPGGGGGTRTYTRDCTIYYRLTSDDTYDANETYYELNESYYYGDSMEEVTLSPTIVGTKEEDDLYKSSMNMAGYYRKETVSSGNSLEGYYNLSGVAQSGTSSGGTYYKLLQYYNASGEEELFDSNSTYYYLTTRDTNVVIMTSGMSSSWGSTFTRPFTLTGINNGTDYGAVWDVSDTSVIAYTDLRIENLTIKTETNKTTAGPSPSYSTSADAVFYGNFHNVKLGRNIKQSGNYVNFISVIGGMNASQSGYGWGGSTYDTVTTGSTLNPKKWKMEVESGVYNTTSSTYGATSSSSAMNTLYGIQYTVYGNDYDRATDNDERLEVVYCAAGSWSGYIHSSNDTTTAALNAIVKSGTLGSNEYDTATGIYAGGRYGGTHYAPRTIKVEGGSIYNVIGGPLSANGKEGYNDTYIYMTGGDVDFIIGGAGTSTTYGNRIVQVTGGTVHYSVFGGSNGYEYNSSTDGTLTGDTYVYVGGTATIGDDSLLSSTNNPFDIESGSVFGAGNGNSDYETIGSVKNSNIIIADEAVIKKNVYGSGNFGTVGYTTSASTTNTKIHLLGGTVNGNVFGSGNNSGSGRDGSVTSSIEITLDGGTVTNGIYGGSNSSGTVYGSTEINAVNGTSTDVYGGGYGSNTNVSQNVQVNIGDTESTTNLSITGSVYGGSGFGVVNATSSTDNVSTYTTKVDVYAGTINNVFGGGKGDSDNTPCVAGPVTVTVHGGNITNVFGANDASGMPNGTITVDLNGGTISSAYGGGNQAEINTSTITLDGATVTTAVFGGGNQAGATTTNVVVTSGTAAAVYGGSNSSGNVTTSNVTINGGTITDTYGGNNSGGITSTSQVSLNGGTISSAYGGGNQATTTTSNITLNGATVTTAVFGGGNNAGVTTTNVTLASGSSPEVYGGSNSSGTVTTSNVTSNNPTNLTVTSVYGGNNQAGTTQTANVNLTGGTYTNIYGGGNVAPTNNTVVTANGITVTGYFFGGGNQANVNYNTDVTLNSSTVSNDLYGGGNLGIVYGNTNVKISGSTIGRSAYAGGNGSTAVVQGNTNLKIDNASVINSHVFGGGNAANTGTDLNHNSASTVDIAGATIHGNVYGGANTAVLYGTTVVRIGYEQDSLIKTDIQIDGTVFGGGEANASGSEIYDFDFISVTEGIDIYIDGDGYNNFNISGSIFGSGNASSSGGYSNIYIYNYGTFNDYKENVSIQRTDHAYISNSAIHLSGTTDRTNEFSQVEFTLSRIKRVTLADNSTLFLDTGSNLVEEFYSVKTNGNTEEKATVTISDTGSTTRNVNNRLYMFQGKNLNIATNEAVTSYGDVSGMTFFGMYLLDQSGKVVTALYDNQYSNGSTVPSGDLYAFNSGSYVLGEHYTNHNIKVDGFYSNFIDEENEGKIYTDYIEPTPKSGAYYMWVVGEEIKSIDIELTASKYSTMGATEVPMVSFGGANTTYEILGFNFIDLAEGMELVDPSLIPRVNTQGTADTKMGLGMEPSNTGFLTSGNTIFTTDVNNSILGVKNYKVENSEAVPSFFFYLYHSKNISETKNMGTVVVSLAAITPIDQLNNEVTRVNINITLSSALFNSNEYEGAMTTGEKYSMFTSSATNINTHSAFSAYYSLFLSSENEYYGSNYHHSLVSSYVYPVNTKLTMIDLVDNETYYLVVDETIYNSTLAEFNQYGECSYELAKFIKMGSTSPTNNFNESANNDKYYDPYIGFVEEEFIIMVNFEDTNITGNQLGNSLLIELRDGNQTLFGVLGRQRASLVYNLYDDADATLELEGTISSNTIYVGDSATVELTGNFTQPKIDSLPIVDTTHFDKKPGIRITLWDSNGNQLNNSSLFGLNYEIDGVTYYPRMDGSVRIALAERVANIFTRIKINTANTILASGDYTLKIESFTSPDGIYYGTNASDTLEIPIQVINSSYGLKVSLEDNELIIAKENGYTLENTNALNFAISFTSNLSNPNIRVSLMRRNYNTTYEFTYEVVDLKQYISNALTETDADKKEYLFLDTIEDGGTKTLYLKENLTSGTYKFVFRLYDGDAYIGDCAQYVIIK